MWYVGYHARMLKLVAAHSIMANLAHYGSFLPSYQAIGIRVLRPKDCSGFLVTFASPWLGKRVTNWAAVLSAATTIGAPSLRFSCSLVLSNICFYWLEVFRHAANAWKESCYGDSCW